MQESWIADPPRRRASFDLSACLLLFLASAVLRLYFVHASADTHWLRTPWPGGEVDLVWRAASQLRAGLPFRPSFEIMAAPAPLHTAWLALTQSILGDSLHVHRLLGALLYSLTPVVVYRVGALVFRDRSAAVAGAVLILLLPSTLFSDTLTTSTSMGLLVLSLLIHQLVTLESDRRSGGLAWHAARCGVLLSMLWLLRESAVLYAIVAVAYVAARQDLARSHRRLVIVVMSALLASTAIGAGAGGSLLGQSAFVPNGGVELRIGNQAGATGYRSPLLDLPSGDWGQGIIARMETELRRGERLSPAAANRVLALETAKEVARRPLRAIRRAYRKLPIFFNDFEPAGEYFIGYVERVTPFIRRMPGRFGLLVMFGLVGALSMLLREKRTDVLLLAGFLAAVLAWNMLTYVTWRTRLDAVVPLSLLAGAGISLGVELLSEWQTSRYTWRPLIVRRTIAVLLVGVLGAWLGFRELRPPDVRVAVQVSQRNFDRSLGAERARRSLESRYAPSAIGSEGEWVARCRLLHKLERHSECRQILSRLLRDGPSSDSWVNGQYLTYLLWLGEVDGAARHLDAIEHRDPRWLEQVMRRRSELEKRYIERFVTPERAVPGLPRELLGFGGS